MHCEHSCAADNSPAAPSVGFDPSKHPSPQPLPPQSFQKDITLNTERIDGLIVSGEGLIQRSAPLDAALIEDELEELHSYCQEVFSRVVRFHQRLTQPPVSISALKKKKKLCFLVSNATYIQSHITTTVSILMSTKIVDCNL